jgi:hypothetical protein
MLKRLIRSILLLCVLFASSQLFAQNCASSGCDGKPPPVYLPPMDINGNPYPPGMAAGDRAAYDAAHRGGGNTQGAGQVGGGGGNTATPEGYKPDTLKTDRRFCIRSNDTCDGWFLSATSRCGSIFQNNGAYLCSIGAEAQRNDSCAGLRAANTC